VAPPCYRSLEERFRLHPRYGPLFAPGWSAAPSFIANLPNITCPSRVNIFLTFSLFPYLSCCRRALGREAGQSIPAVSKIVPSYSIAPATIIFSSPAAQSLVSARFISNTLPSSFRVVFSTPFDFPRQAPPFGRAFLSAVLFYSLAIRELTAACPRLPPSILCSPSILHDVGEGNVGQITSAPRPGSAKGPPACGPSRPRAVLAGVGPPRQGKYKAFFPGPPPVA
jgi:hypothetical protein